jgi:hypothetical protein
MVDIHIHIDENDRRGRRGGGRYLPEHVQQMLRNKGRQALEMRCNECGQSVSRGVSRHDIEAVMGIAGTWIFFGYPVCVRCFGRMVMANPSIQVHVVDNVYNIYGVDD